MKRFRIVTMATIAAIALMVVANVWYLHGLYASIKEESVRAATECLRRADILEIISQLKGPAADEDPFLRLTLLVEGEQSDDGGYAYPNLLQNLDKTMSDYFHIIASSSPQFEARNMDILKGLFIKELSAAGLHPKEVMISESPLPEFAGKYWQVEIKGPDGKPFLIAYLSPLDGYVLGRMAGIVVSSSLIVLLASFLIWYLMHWVGKLKSIEQMKDDFTHNMTHELKTPVAVAYSAADSMLRYYNQSDEERNKRFLSIILQRLSHLSGMIENILSMSMERFKSMRLNPERVPVRSLAEDVAGMIEMKADKPISIDIAIPEDLAVTADPLHFGNVISNLLDNAVKYSGDSASVTICGDASGISITDRGIGISPKDLPHIFEKFFRVTDGDRYEVGGYGLGLYYVRQIVEMHGWEIAVESKEGVGTSFTIKFEKDEKR